MNHSVKSAVEYTIFGIGIVLGLGICALPMLVHYGLVHDSFMVAGMLTPFIGVVILVATIWWGVWAHNRCKNDVCAAKIEN